MTWWMVVIAVFLYLLFGAVLSVAIFGKHDDIFELFMFFWPILAIFGVIYWMVTSIQKIAIFIVDSVGWLIDFVKRIKWGRKE